MEESPNIQQGNISTLPDEDGTIMVYGFVQITDVQTGEILVNVRS